MSAEATTFLLPDGRTLAYSVYGSSREDTGYPLVFYFHSFPGCRLECALWERSAQKLGLCLVAVDRPGMGLSTFHENRTIGNWSDDILALANHLHIQEFGVLGVSGGAPYVLACLKNIPCHRLKAAASVSGLYPCTLGTAGMTLKNRILLWVSPWAPNLVAKFMDLTLGWAARDQAHPEKFTRRFKADLLGDNKPNVDLHCLQRVLDDPTLWVPVFESVRGSMSVSSRGNAWEAALFGWDWGFKLSDVEARKLVIWHGALDANVPVRMADKAAGMLRGARYERLDEHAHCSLLFSHSEEILESLAEMMRR